jgi:hypothetical protein
MATFTNKSQAVFQDGDLVVPPGESFSTDEQSRIDQMRGQYAWQFSESEGDNAPSEGELQERGAGSVREIRGSSHVQVDADGAQAEVVGQPEDVQADVEDAAKGKKGSK